MNEQSIKTGLLFRTRPLVFLLPAVLVASLIAALLPVTVPTLSPLPEKAVLETPIEAKAAEKPEPEKEKEELPPGAYQDGIYIGNSTGFGGDVQVQVTVQNGRITEILVLSAPGETEPYLSLAKTVIGTVVDQQTWEVDVISGATYSSRGILGAIRNAITGEEVINEEPEIYEPEIDEESFEEPAAYKDGIYTGSAQGFGGTITVEVVISGGRITDIRVVSAPDESDSYLSSAMAVIGRMLQAGSPNVDTVSGATYSSTGIITATNRALSQAAAGETAVKQPSAETPGNTTEKKTDETAMPNRNLKDGEYTGSGEGFGGKIEVRITVNGGRIVKIEIISAENETAEFLNLAKRLIPNIISGQKTDVDTISGATYSSKGIIAAVKEAVSKAEKAFSGNGESGDDSGTDPGGDIDPSGDSGEDEEQSRYEDGVYTAQAECVRDQFFDYTMEVSVTIEDGKITDVAAVRTEDRSEFPEDNEEYLDYAINGRVRKEINYTGIPSQIIDNQTADTVDTVSGATYSSRAIQTAAQEALKLSAAKKEEREKNGGGEEQGGTTVPEDPGQTTEPQDPGQTTEPQDPGQTTEPQDPGQTTGPEDPGQTTGPENPGHKTEPEDPGQTTEPEDPGQTTEPEDPDQTTEPEDPDQTTDNSENSGWKAEESEGENEPLNPETDPAEGDVELRPGGDHL